MFATRPNGWPENPRTLTRKSNENLVPIVPLKYRRAEMFSVSTIRFLMQMRPRKGKQEKIEKADSFASFDLTATKKQLDQLQMTFRVHKKSQ